MIRWFLQLVAQFKLVVLAVLLVLVLKTAATTLHKSGSVIGAGVVLFAGAVMMYLANNIAVVESKVGPDVINPGSWPAPGRSPAVVVLARVDGRVVVYRSEIV